MKMTARPVAYIRRSARTRTDPGDISREFQADTVRRLAGTDGPQLAILDGDWGKSAATDATDKRLAFLGLMDSIERGDVTTLFAYSTDRLARSVQWAARLLDACEKAGTTIVTNEGRFEPGDDMARTLFQFQAITNENYSRQAKKKAQATVATRRARGSKLGQPFYGSLPGESLDTVLATFQRVGSFHGTATALSELGLPARRGNGWSHSTVQRILEREGKAPRLGTRGAKFRAPHLLHRLLTCHCGRTLTGSLRAPDRQGRRLTIYRCLPAETKAGHGKKSVAEARLMPFIRAEAAHLDIPADKVALEGIEARQAAINDRLDRAREVYIETGDRAKYDTEKARAHQDLDALEARASMADIAPEVDWDAPPIVINTALRSMWREVRLDEHLMPVEADWIVPEWRS